MLRDSFLTTLTSPSTTVREGKSYMSQLNGFIVASRSQVRLSCGCGRICPWLTLDLVQRTNLPLKIQELRHLFFYHNNVWKGLLISSPHSMPFGIQGALLVFIRAVSSFPVTRNSFKWPRTKGPRISLKIWSIPLSSQFYPIFVTWFKSRLISCRHLANIKINRNSGRAWENCSICA